LHRNLKLQGDFAANFVPPTPFRGLGFAFGPN